MEILHAGTAGYTAGLAVAAYLIAWAIGVLTPFAVIVGAAAAWIRRARGGGENPGT